MRCARNLIVDADAATEVGLYCKALKLGYVFCHKFLFSLQANLSTVQMSDCPSIRRPAFGGWPG
jgi:hypothetical protein